MQQKNKLRKKYFKLRKKNYRQIDKTFFLPLLKLIKFRLKKKFFKIAIYYPSNFELNVLKILEFNSISVQDILLPVINKKKSDELFFLEKKRSAIC